MKKPFTISFFLILFYSACIQQSENPSSAVPTLQKEFINQHNGYSEAVSVVSGGVKTIYISGQIGEGETFEQQMRSAIANMQSTLKVAGATMDDVVNRDTMLPLVRDPDRSIYIRQEIDSLILGLYESKVKQWYPEGVPWEYARSELQPDIDHDAHQVEPNHIKNKSPGKPIWLGTF